MKKVKITIVKTMLNEDLAKEYGIPGLKACPMMKVGDVFYADYAKPNGFCDEAWKAIYQYVFALAHGADKGLFYYGDWIKEPGVAIVRRTDSYGRCNCHGDRFWRHAGSCNSYDDGIDGECRHACCQGQAT